MSAEGGDVPTKATRQGSSSKGKAVSTKKKSSKKGVPVKSHSIQTQRSEWGSKSLITATDLVTLKSHYKIPDSCPLHLQSDGEYYDSPQGENRWALSVEALRQGFRLPASDFTNDLLKTYKVAPSQLTPNAWGTLTVFQVACAYVGLSPSVSLFKRFHRFYPKGCAWVISTYGIRFLQEPQVKNATDRWLRPWFLVENGFAPEVPRHYTQGKEEPEFAYTAADLLDHKKMEISFKKTQLSFACVLSERVLLKAKISTGDPPQESFGKFSLLYFLALCLDEKVLKLFFLVYSDELFAEVDTSVSPYFFLDSEGYAKKASRKRKVAPSELEEEKEISSDSSVPEETEEIPGQLLRERAAATSKSGRILRPKQTKVAQATSQGGSSSTPPLIADAGFPPSSSSPSLGASMCKLIITPDGLAPWRSGSDEERRGALFDKMSSVNYPILFFFSLYYLVGNLRFPLV